MKRIALALATAAALSGCGIFKGDGKTSKTPVLGQRIPVLTAEAGAEADAGIADVPVTVPPAESNADWAQPGGNAWKSPGNLALGASLTRVWTASIDGSSPKARLAANPVVADGKLFVVDTQARLHAFNAATGAALWTVPVAATGDGDAKNGRQATGNARALFGGGVSYAEGKLYATDGIGDAAAFDAANGTLVWRVRPGGPLRGAPTVANGHVYVMSQDNQLFALDQTNGQVVWTSSGTLETAGVFGVGAPAAAQGTVVAGYSSGELTAYRYENGRAVWQDALSRTSITTSVATLSDIDAAPVIDQGRVYAVGEGGRMVAMELNTGQRLWELNIAGIETPAVAGEWLFVVTDDARLLCIARTSGRVRWVTQLDRWRNAKKKRGTIGWGGPVVAGDRLLLTNTEGQMLSVGLDGTVGTAIEAGKTFYQAPIVAGGMAYTMDDEGRITAWR